jgi:mannose-1-phosphate guanylyltransferase
MNNDNIYAVLMAGGVGSRFWPQSRKAFPKQLLKIHSDQQMIAATSARLLPLIPAERQIVVTNILQVDGIRAALPDVPAQNILVEPMGRNTAPCIGLAGVFLEHIDPEAIMVVLPSDHLIDNTGRFRQLLGVAAEYAEKTGNLVTMGIKPTYPETGYGYIQMGDVLTRTNDISIHRVKTFAEKPNYETAKRFLDSGDFSWNSGMFIWTVDAILREIEEHLPDLFESLGELKPLLFEDNSDTELHNIYGRLAAISIDYGVMEKSARVATIAGDFGWNDVGSWDVVYDLMTKDDDNNAASGPDTLIALNAYGNLVNVSADKAVALIDVENLAIVETEDAILVCPRGNTQKVKEIVENLEAKKLDKYL